MSVKSPIKHYFKASEILPIITLSNVDVTSSQTITDYHGIIMLKQAQDFVLTADLSDPDSALTQPSALNAIFEKVVKQTQVVGDERFIANIENDVITITAPNGFEQTGNYMLTAERLNEGLTYLNLPFRVAFDTVEFDVQRN